MGIQGRGKGKGYGKENRLSKLTIVIYEPSRYELEFSALQHDAIIRATVVVEVAKEDIRNITDAALLVGVVLAGARLPAAIIVDVGFPRWVPEVQEPPRDDWDRILEVGDTDESIQFVVDEIGELFVSDLKK